MSGTPRFTALITVHNAAGSIAACLRSITQQDGIETRELEIVLIDDRSTDGTSEIAAALGMPNLRIIHVDKPLGTGLTTRQDALSLGIAASRGDIVLTTDADGIVARDWLVSLTRPILAGGADAVAGPVAFRGGGGGLARWQTVDVSYYLAVCSLLNAAGFPGGVLFGNFAFRRDLFDEVGGFERIGFSLTEDLAFSRALHAHGARVAYVVRGSVEVEACTSWSVLVERAKRVSAGGFSALALVLGVWMALLPVLALLALLPGGFFGWLFLARYLAGVLYTGWALIRVGRTSLLPAAPFYEPLAVAIGVRVMTKLRKNSRVEWGGTHYAR